MDFLAGPLAPILAAFYAFASSYGLAIILLTLSVRVLLLPLSIKSTRSMREMQLIQPEIKRLQKKYKGDRQKLNTEMMALYKEHGVNPFGGCLPLLMQMPVFFALFYLIRDPLAYLAENVSLATDLQEKALSVHNFLGLRLDCSPIQAYQGEASSVPNIGELCTSGGVLNSAPYFLLIILMGASTYYQQRQMMARRGPTTDPQQQQMQMVAKFMPALLLFFGVTFPTGVVLYWVTTNLWTIVQQRIMLKAAPAIDVGSAKADGAGKKKTDEKAAGGKPAKGKAAAGSDGKGKTGQLKSGLDKPPAKSPKKKSPSSGSASKGSSKKKKR